MDALQADNCQKWTNSAQNQSQCRSLQYQCAYQIWWKSIKVYSSNCIESKMHMYCGHIILSEINSLQSLAIPMQIFTMSVHIPSLVKSHGYLLKLSSRIDNTDVLRTENAVKNWRFTIPNQISTISMHIPSLVKIIDIYSSYHPEANIRTDGRTTDWRTDRLMDTRTAKVIP